MDFTVAFDFDGCLEDLPQVQQMCEAYVQANAGVHIITYRWPGQADNWRVFKTAMDAGIPEANIHFCGGLDKVEVANRLCVDVYYDDDAAEIHRMNHARLYGDGNCLGVCVNYTMHDRE